MTDKEQYEAAIVARLEVQAFIDKKRCATCEHRDDRRGMCTAMSVPIPAEYLYTPSDCEWYAIDIPF